MPEPTNELPTTADSARSQRERYWRMARGLTIGLLLAWFCMTFGVLFFARELAGYTLFGWPFSFYMAAQGLTLFYLLLVTVYVFGMRFLDNRMKGDDRA